MLTLKDFLRANLNLSVDSVALNRKGESIVQMSFPYTKNHGKDDEGRDIQSSHTSSFRVVFLKK